MKHKMLSTHDIFSNLTSLFFVKIHIKYIIIMFVLIILNSKWSCMGFNNLILIKKKKKSSIIILYIIDLNDCEKVRNNFYCLITYVKLSAHTLLYSKERFDDIKFAFHFSYTFQCMIFVLIIGMYVWLMLKNVISKFWFFVVKREGQHSDMIGWKKWYVFPFFFPLIYCIFLYIINTWTLQISSILSVLFSSFMN